MTMLNQNTIPSNVGIRAIELYFPKYYVDQAAFAEFHGQQVEKYLNALCLREMSFCDDNEDVCTLALTVTSSLLKNYNINPSSIGMLVVGTETLIDKSKSVKTALMPLFGENTCIEGVDVKNACYGGTQALFHAMDWVYSRYETEGKLAIVVMADIAIYEPDSRAECTGGGGAVALLIGPDAPLVLEKSLISTHMADHFDFYKPIGGSSSEFPRVDGKASLECYLNALKVCYNEYRRRFKKSKEQDCSIAKFYATIFHCPFFQLVKKAFAELYHLDCQSKMINGHEEHLRLTNGDAHDRDNYWMNASTDLMKQKLSSFVEFNQRIGNMYTASLYASLVSVIKSYSEQLNGQRVLLFSYGSGVASSMFSLVFDLSSETKRNEMEKMCQISKQCQERLDQRICKPPKHYKQAIQHRIDQITNVDKEYEPQASVDALFPNTFYITNIDSKLQRNYAQHIP